MANQHENRVTSFFNKTMNEQEREQFLEDVQHDVGLRQVYEEYKLAIDVIDQRVEINLRSDFSQWEEDKKPGKTRWLNMYTSIAASVLILVGVYLVFGVKRIPETNEQLAGEFYVLPEAPESTMGEEDEHWSKGIEAFKNKSYRDAVEEWNMMDSKTFEVNYYLAHSYYNLKDYKNAGALFKVISENKNIYSYAAEWYLFLTYLISDDNSYQILLEKIISEKDHPFNGDAIKINERIK